MRADKIAAKQPVRMMIVGYPGTAKTGSLASLANAGYKLRILDFDGNSQSLLTYTKPEFLSNIDIVSFEDKMRNGQRFIETTGVPTAFANALNMMDEWKYKDGDEEINLGKSKEWGCDTVVVLDSLTSMGEASFRRQRSLSNKTPLDTTQQVWGLAMEQQNAFIEKLTSEANHFHVIVLSHLKMIGPKDIQKADEDVTKELKSRAADIIATRLFPSALGQGLPPTIGGHFPTLILAENEFVGERLKDRVLRTVPRPELDLKLPSKVSFDKASVSDGLAKIFAEVAPSLASCGNNTEEKKV